MFDDPSVFKHMHGLLWGLTSHLNVFAEIQPGYDASLRRINLQ